MLNKTTPLLYGDFEVLQRAGYVVTFAVTVDADEGDILQGFFESIKAT
jgi:hypothetical protein